VANRLTPCRTLQVYYMYACSQFTETLKAYMNLAELWNACSSCAGFCCALGNIFFEKGIQEIDTTISSTLQEWTPVSSTNRELQANAILFWFAKQV